MLVTALVQSSSAVTVAAIGFVNAGLLGLAPALWVLFGANVGTTMTGWIVALVGLKFKIEALALPLVGAGVVLRLTGEGQRRGAIGSALAGFGLLFLGIAMLQESFTGLAGQVALPQGEGPLAVLAQVLVGALMTVLMQSSSASMTIALTAAQGGLLTTQGAAAVVIGANLGTTVTALLAAVGATPNARRAAAAHVIFNVVTGVVALLLLPWLIGALGVAREALDLPPDPAAKLALFHTTFNLLGVMLMWPLADALTRWLLRRFRAREEDEAQPRYLDDNVLAVPTLAMDALEREVGRTGHLALQLARSALAGAGVAALAREEAVVARLDAAVEAFVERMNRGAMARGTAERLARTLRVQRYHETTAEQALAAAPLRPPAAAGAEVEARHADFVAQAHALLILCDPTLGEAETAAIDDALQSGEVAYQNLKAALLAAGARGNVRMADMEAALRRYSAMRRAVQQAAKAKQRLTAPASHADDTARAEPQPAQTPGCASKTSASACAPWAPGRATKRMCGGAGYRPCHRTA
ncbi:MAG TPA: Na/Pi symporter, partial [Rubrivivax sp.]|nr:Na/Pi symporter [Rubrivivax sp.]